MRSRCTHILMLTAWLLATGVQWDVVQVGAWTRMFVNNAQVLPLRDAWELTFSVDGRCSACQVVQDAKEESGGSPASLVSAAREPLVFQCAGDLVVPAPSSHPWIATDVGTAGRERPQPATPPPRRLA